MAGAVRYIFVAFELTTFQASIHPARGQKCESPCWCWRIPQRLELAPLWIGRCPAERWERPEDLLSRHFWSMTEVLPYCTVLVKAFSVMLNFPRLTHAIQLKMFRLKL